SDRGFGDHSRNSPVEAHLQWPDQGDNRTMSSSPQIVDLAQVATVPWAWVDEKVYAAIRGCSVKVLQNERRLNIGCRFRRVNGTSIRSRLGDIWAFMDSQPGGGGCVQPTKELGRKRGRPRRSST